MKLSENSNFVCMDIANLLVTNGYLASARTNKLVTEVTGFEKRGQFAIYRLTNCDKPLLIYHDQQEKILFAFIPSECSGYARQGLTHVLMDEFRGGRIANLDHEIGLICWGGEDAGETLFEIRDQALSLILGD